MAKGDFHRRADFADLEIGERYRISVRRRHDLR